MIEFVNNKYQLSFKLRISDYQYKEILSGYDGNWLMVKYEVCYQDQQFTIEDPSLLTTELAYLIKWFDDISNNMIPKFIVCDFIEPCLEFQLIANINGFIRYAIKLDSECKPNFTIKECDSTDQFVMVFENTLDEIKEMKQQLEKEYSKFPPRGNFGND